jgi:hypothetical protein
MLIHKTRTLQKVEVIIYLPVGTSTQADPISNRFSSRVSLCIVIVRDTESIITMKLSFAAFALTLVPTAAFTAPKFGKTRSAIFSTVEPPKREAPGAGWVPEWENREGLSPGEFIKSDMSKPDRSGMWECPLTRWDSDG